MPCPHCAHERTEKHGKHRNGLQRFRCPECGKTFTEPHERPIGDMRLPLDRAELALRMLLEGNSIRSTSRITGIAPNTLCKLVAMVGTLCENFMWKMIERVPVENVQVDELWGFVQCKEKTRQLRHPNRFDRGDAYCFLGIERNSRLIVAWHVGKRNARDSYAFAVKLKRATAGRLQLSTDGFGGYESAIPSIMGRSVDWGTIVKAYVPPATGEQRRYSPAKIVHIRRTAMIGQPDERMICTPHVERVNLTLRMGIRRLTRLTNGFSKKWGNHEAAHSMFFAAYNFVRVHSTLRKQAPRMPRTPAMAAGLTDHVWTVRELLENAAALAT
ncbi:MAG: hypothetical protein WD069_02725 [Planctomycetales bacterium]